MISLLMWRVIIKMKTDPTIGKLLNSIFYPLKIWIEASNNNWNMNLGFSFLLLLLGILLIYTSLKIGNYGERTN